MNMDHTKAVSMNAHSYLLYTDACFVLPTMLSTGATMPGFEFNNNVSNIARYVFEN